MLKAEAIAPSGDAGGGGVEEKQDGQCGRKRVVIGTLASTLMDLSIHSRLGL